MTNIAIAIPARYASTRLPGKPLAMIAGKTMLERVVTIAKSVTTKRNDINISVFIATEDDRIAAHANDLNTPCIMTPESCATGSDRVLSALRQLDQWPDFVINLQGDAPFTPPSIIEKICDAFQHNPRAEVITPIHRLNWEDLDRLRLNKSKTPFSGTTSIINGQGRALWFSKNIIPAIRKEADLRENEEYSPVHQHIGLYGFRTDILEKFCSLTHGVYENLEGLEQLRMLEHNIRIDTVLMDIEHGHIQSGIDSPEDIIRAEDHIKQHGEMPL